MLHTALDRPRRSRARPGAVAVGALAVGALALTLALAPLAGCGAGGASSGGVSAASSAGQQSSDVDSGAGRLDAAAFTRRVAEAMRVKGTATVTSTGGMPMTVHLWMSQARVDLEATAGSGPDAWRMIVVDGVAYVRAGEPVDGRHWIKFDPAQESFLPAGPGWQLAQWSDPSQALAGLAGEVSAIKSGGEVVDGVRTTEYTVSLTTEQLTTVAQARPGLAPAAAPAGASMVIHYFVDDAWLPRRVVTETVSPGQRALVTTLVYRDWGGPVTIAAPDPSDVRAGSS